MSRRYSGSSGTGRGGSGPSSAAGVRRLVESPSIASAVYPVRGTVGGTVARDPHRRRGIGAAGSIWATAGAPVESRGGILKNVGIDSRIADISERSIRARPDRGRLRRVGLGNFFRPSQAETLGITYDRLRRLEAAGEVERVARGLYRLADAEPTERYSLAAVCALVPNSVVCLLSALEVHEVGSRAPLEVWLAIPHKARPPRVSGVRVRLLRFSGAAWAHGVQETRFEGVPARITSPARTVVDCFRFERLIGREAALEALYDALRLRKVTTADLDRTLRVLPSRLLTAALETREP